MLKRPSEYVPPQEEWQYTLRADEDGWYPNIEYGGAKDFYKNGLFNDKIYLKKGEIWKICTSVDPEGRYPQSWRTRMGLTKFDEFKGPPQAVIMVQNMKLAQYKLMHGQFPPDNTKLQ